MNIRMDNAPRPGGCEHSIAGTTLRPAATSHPTGT